MTSLWSVLENANRLIELENQRYESRQLAEELRRNSDDLTRMARTYAATGDIRFKSYFETIVAIRDGKEPRPDNYQNIFWDFVTANHDYMPSEGGRVAIVELMGDLHFTSEELMVLAEAKVLSDQLLLLEQQAFNAMEGLFKSEGGQYTVKGQENRERAYQILHGQAYHQLKANIMENINVFFIALDSRTFREMRDIKAGQQHAVFFAIALSGVLVIFSALAYFYFNRAISAPLAQLLVSVKKMREGNYDFENNINKDDELGSLSEAFTDMAATVASHIRDLERVSRTDQLTKINNRIALDEALIEEKYKFDRYHAACSIILLDIDDFKKVNDKFGHLTGDKVLVEIAGLLKDSLRKSDIVGRWGGEEFLIICPNTDLETVRVVAESVRERISEFSFSEAGHKTSSFGISTFEKDYSIESVIDQADKALYRAKQAGRNKVC
jgi:diguanylate cyclase (GGDEF)-like protein